MCPISNWRKTWILKQGTISGSMELIPMFGCLRRLATVKRLWLPDWRWAVRDEGESDLQGGQGMMGNWLILRLQADRGI